MKRALELREVVDDERIINAIARFVERRSASHRTEDVIADATVTDAFARYAIGNHYGRFHETITRRELRKAGTPLWFDPREHEGQYGIIGDSPVRCYIQVAVNHEARSQPSTFDKQILELVERTPEQTGLFG